VRDQRLQHWQQKYYKDKKMIDKGIKNMQVQKDSKLKEWLINYVGNKENPKDDGVTVEMVVSVVADEFPEFLFVIAEENFLRGYEQALDDVKMLNEKNDQNTQIHKENSHNNN
jgi:hypothetical protein